MVRTLGADVVLPDDGPEAVDALDSAVRYDVIIDIAGNRPPRRARRALTPCGTLAFIGIETDGRLTGGSSSWLLRVAGWTVISRRRFRPVMPTERGEDNEAVVQLAAGGAITRRSIASLASRAPARRCMTAPRVGSAARSPCATDTDCVGTKNSGGARSGCEVQLRSRTLTVSTCCWKAATLPSRMAHT